MAKQMASVNFDVDSLGRPKKALIVQPGKKPIEAEYAYLDVVDPRQTSSPIPTSVLKGITVTGQKADLPKVTELLGLFSNNFQERIATVQSLPTMEELTRDEWGHNGNYPEDWAYGFNPLLYHGRNNAFFVSDAAKQTPLESLALPKIILNDNPIEPNPWRGALLVRNSQDGVNIDELYVGLPRAHFRGEWAFSAKLPSPSGGKPDKIFIGFECTSGGSTAFLVCLVCLAANGWILYAVNEAGILSSPTITLNNPGVYSRYKLRYDPPFLELWEAPAANPTGFPLVRTAQLFLADKCAKAIPFVANEDETGVSEFRFGRNWFEEFLPRKQVFRVISAASIAASSSTFYNLDCTFIQDLALTIRCTYDAAATAGVTVWLLASPDNSTNDSQNTTDAWTSFSPSFAAGTTKQRTVNLDALPRYVAIIVQNNDTVKTVTNVYVDAHIKGVSA